MRDIKNILKQYNKNNKIKVLDFKYEPVILNGITKIKKYFLYLEHDIHLYMRISNFEKGANKVIGLENKTPLNCILALLKFNRIENCSELTKFKQIIQENNIVF